jgi:hypothetical protein
MSSVRNGFEGGFWVGAGADVPRWAVTMIPGPANLRLTLWLLRWLQPAVRSHE